MLYSDPDRILRSVFSEDVLGLFGPKSYSSGYFWWKKYVRVLMTMFEREIRTTDGEGNVLEIGCGNGFNLFRLASLAECAGMLFVGVDLSGSGISFANTRKKMTAAPNLSFLIGDGSYLAFTEATFDIVVCTEVLEHLPSPNLCIEEMFRALKPGGIAIITTPNKGSLFARFGKALRRLSSSRRPSISREDHISVNTFAAWKNMFQASGFIIERRKRGALVLGGQRYDAHRILFALLMILEAILDRIPFWWNLSEDIILSLRKPKTSKSL